MADVIKIHQCFPTVINEFKLDIPVHDNIQMLNYINLIKNTNDNVSVNQTEDTLYNLSFFKYFKDNILDLHKEILDGLGYEYEDILITNMWGNISEVGDIHPPHTHSNNFFSGVFYLQADEQASSIHFTDPRPQASVLVPRRKQNNLYNSNILGFSAKEGIGFIFPSWLQHWVPATGSERISISWNIMVKGHYGEPTQLQNAYI